MNHEIKNSPDNFPVSFSVKSIPNLGFYMFLDYQSVGFRERNSNPMVVDANSP